MKHCLTHWLIVVLSAFTATVSAQEATFVLEGDLSAIYASGNFVVWTPKPAPETGDGAAATMAAASTATTAASPAASTSTATSGAAMTAAATSASGAGSTSSRESSLNVIARAPLGADGTFRVEAAVDTPREVYFYVLDAMGHEGRRYAPTKGNEFILEPGNLRLHMTRRGRFYIEGGPYNDAVYNSWRRSDEYAAAEAEYLRLIPSVDGETEDERRARVDGSSAAFNRMLELETEGRARVSTTHPDPLVRRLTIESAWLGGPWMLDAWRGLAEMTPDDPYGSSIGSRGPRWPRRNGSRSGGVSRSARTSRTSSRTPLTAIRSGSPTCARGASWCWWSSGPPGAVPAGPRFPT